MTFSELHGLTATDMDGDRVPDIVVGKRYWAHQEELRENPESDGGAGLVHLKTVRNRRAPGGAEFVPELVHNRSGVGSTVLAADVNEDGVTDIVRGTKLGMLLAFLGKRR